MATGTGIAIAGIWIGCGIVWMSRATGPASILVTAIALGLTIYLK